MSVFALAGNADALRPPWFAATRAAALVRRQIRGQRSLLTWKTSTLWASAPALQTRLLGEFERWLAEHLKAPARTSVDSSAKVFCSIRAARLWQPSLYVWAAFVQSGNTFYQKNRLLLRPYVPLCWDLLTRWDRFCYSPPQSSTCFDCTRHDESGTGLDLAASVRGHWAFFSWRGSSRRKELPAFTLQDEASSLYVGVEKPKMGNRGSGRVQNFLVREHDFICFAQKVYGRSEAPLFGASPSLFGGAGTS